MRKSLYVAAALAIGTAAFTAPLTPAYAQQEFASPLIPPKLPPQAVPQEVKAAWGCVISGTAATVAAMAGNAENLINVVAGGIVTPANPAVLYLGLAGVVFTSFCTLGQQLTPLYLYYFSTPDEPEVDIAKTPNHRMASRTRPALADEDLAYPWESAR